MRRLIAHHWFPYAVLAAAVAVASAAILYFVDFGLVQQALRDFHGGYMGLSLVALFIFTLFYALRWRLLLENKPGFWYTYHTANVGHAVNALIPLRAGEVARIGIMGGDKRLGLGYTAVVLSYLVERIFEQMMRLAAFGVALLTGGGDVLTPQQILSVIVPLILAFLFLFIAFINQERIMRCVPPLFGRWPVPFLSEARVSSGLAGFFRNLNAVSSPWRLIQIFFLSGVVWFWGALYHLLVLMAMGRTFPFEDWLTITFGSLAFSPPSATTQPIIFQSLIVGPLAVAGFDQNDLFAYAVLLNVSQAVLFIFLGLVGLTQLRLSFRGVQKMLAQGNKVRQMMRRHGEVSDTAVLQDLDEATTEVRARRQLSEQELKPPNNPREADEEK